MLLGCQLLLLGCRPALAVGGSLLLAVWGLLLLLGAGFCCWGAGSCCWGLAGAGSQGAPAALATARLPVTVRSSPEEEDEIESEEVVDEGKLGFEKCC